MSILKKIMVILMLAALCAGGTALAEEKSLAGDYVGRWTDLNGIRHLDVQARAADEGYIVNIRMDTFDGEKYGYIAWTYDCAYDEESGTLKSFSRTLGVGDYEPDSTEEITDVREDFTGAVFFLDKEGRLHWDDEDEGLDDGMVFTPAQDDEASEPMPREAAAFEGVWQCGRTTVAMYWEEIGFKVLISQSGSAWEQTEWEYSCFWHAENNTVVSMPFGTRTAYVYGEDGEIASVTEAYSDGIAVFLLDADGCLVWQDEKENAGAGMRFEKITEAPEEQADG